MIEGLEIKGGAGEVEAAVIAVVLDHITREEQATRRGANKDLSALPAWVRAVMTDEPRAPREVVWPKTQ